MQQREARGYDADASGLAACLQTEVRSHRSLVEALGQLGPGERAVVRRLVEKARERRQQWQDEGAGK